jgi:hypothetical protein
VLALFDLLSLDDAAADAAAGTLKRLSAQTLLHNEDDETNQERYGKNEEQI